MFSQLAILFVLMAGAALACEIGYRLGRQTGPGDETFDKQFGIIRGAPLATKGEMPCEI
jgi:hypothetical protein